MAENMPANMPDVDHGVVWRMSPYEDHRAHAFRKLDDQTAVSLCELSFPTGRLGEVDEPKCVVCILMRGRELDEQRDDDLDDWEM